MDHPIYRLAAVPAGRFTPKKVMNSVSHLLDEYIPWMRSDSCGTLCATGSVRCSVSGICSWLLFPGVLVVGASLSNLSVAGAQTNANQREVVTATSSESLGQNRGAYYALVIGIANYQHLPKLVTPVSDANEVEKILRVTYGFKTQFLPDATRDQILEALDHDRRTLGVDDSLLIRDLGGGP